jgi:hypothetical protein
MLKRTKSIFSPGVITATAGVYSVMARDANFKELVQRSLQRHLSGDWGDLCKEDKQENEFSLREGFRLFSAYEDGDKKIWIITEADRSATTVLFPDEY